MPRYHVGADIGGTFTDFCLYDLEAQSLFSLKVPTVVASPAEGVVAGLELLRDEYSVDLGSIEYIVHGSTVAVNTLIERRGARLGLVVTEGFRDVLIIQRLRIPDVQNWFGNRPAPLIPRERVFEVRERLLADGSEHTSLCPDSLRRVLQQAREQRVDGLAVCLLHSYRNPSHEQAVRNFLAREAPDLTVCCSHEVWPRIREYERAIITIVNAYVMPRVNNYLEVLEGQLAALGVPVPPYITRSNGGVMTARAARSSPVDTLLSGPASGVVGAVHTARQAGIVDLITLDIGGTSADVAIVDDGVPQVSQSEHVADFPILAPVIGVSSIGAGGGSVAWLDDAGVLKVGPQSVGSDPGPACYGRGNELPSLTDAFLACGLLNPQTFAGGRIPIHPHLAHAAIQQLAAGLDSTVSEAAEAIQQVAVAALYAELSNVVARRGIDPREYTLVAFGGAGPLLACRVADELGMAQVLVPPSPGTLCALGALVADISKDFVRSIGLPLDAALDVLADAYRELEANAKDWLSSEGRGLDDQRIFLSADMRYRGQSYEVEVMVEPEWLVSGDGQALGSAFHAAHERIFTHADPAAPVEIIDLRLRISGSMASAPKTSFPTGTLGKTEGLPAVSERRVTFGGAEMTIPSYRRESLVTGYTIVGPALVDQDDTTVFIPSQWTATNHESGNLTIGRVQR